MMTKKTVSQTPRILKICKDRQYDCVYPHGKKLSSDVPVLPKPTVFINNWAYQELQIQVLNDPTSISFKPQQVSVDNLCLAYLQHAKEETPDHFSGIKTAVEIKTTEFFVNKHFDRLIIYFFCNRYYVRRG